MKMILIGLIAFFALNIMFETASMVFAPIREDTQVCWAIGPDAISPNARVPGYSDKTPKVNYKILGIVIGGLVFAGIIACIIRIHYINEKNSGYSGF